MYRRADRQFDRWVDVQTKYPIFNFELPGTRAVRFSGTNNVCSTSNNHKTIHLHSLLALRTIKSSKLRVFGRGGTFPRVSSSDGGRKPNG